MSLFIENVEFEYHTENAEKFTKDFLNYVMTDIPFFAIQNELLYMMQRRKLPHFRIPATMTVDSKEHSFFFEARSVPENKRLTVYRYLGMDIHLKGSIDKVSKGYGE